MSHPMPKQGEFCWNELSTKDPEAAKAFYGALLGWQFIANDVGAESPYLLCKSADGKEVGGIFHIPEGQPIPPRWLSYITVDDVDAIADKVVKLGGTIVVPAMQVCDYGRFVVVADPTGAHIAFWQSLKACE